MGQRVTGNKLWISSNDDQKKALDRYKKLAHHITSNSIKYVAPVDNKFKIYDENALHQFMHRVYCIVAGLKIRDPKTDI